MDMARDVAKGFDYSLVDEVVDIIVKEFSPQKIIIFGSVARKEARSSSDINMIVVMEPIIVGKCPASAHIYHATRKINVPKEILVVTPSEYETKRNEEGSLISMMEDEGYAAYELKDGVGHYIRADEIPPYEGEREPGFDYSLAREVIDMTIEKFSPERIVIFGSVARHEACSHSDVDMLVVMEPVYVKGSRFPSTAVRMGLHGINVPMDILVASPEEYEQNRNDGESFISIIEETGFLAYDRKAGIRRYPWCMDITCSPGPGP